MTDFRHPQPFNVEIGAPELADETGARVMPVLLAPYPIPEPMLIERDADLYPPVTHGLRGPRMRRR